jgi:hypothetical protein
VLLTQTILKFDVCKLYPERLQEALVAPSEQSRYYIVYVYERNKDNVPLEELVDGVKESFAL